MQTTPYDDKFTSAASGFDIPLAWLQTWAKVESNLKLDATNPGSTAFGLFQIIDATLGDYNKYAKGIGNPEFTHADLTDAKDGAYNQAQVAVWYTEEYLKKVFGDAGLQPDWTTIRYPEIMYLGVYDGAEDIGKMITARISSGDTKFTWHDLVSDAITALPNSYLAKTDPVVMDRFAATWPLYAGGDAPAATVAADPSGQATIPANAPQDVRKPLIPPVPQSVADVLRQPTQGPSSGPPPVKKAGIGKMLALLGILGAGAAWFKGKR